MTATGLLLLMVSAGSLPDGCLIGPANCALFERQETERVLRCLRYGQAQTVLTSACEQGESDECLELANLVEDCEASPKPERVTDLLIRACALGSPTGCVRTGDRASSPAARNSWYQRAAAIHEKNCEAGEAAACHSLSYFLINGLHGTKRDERRGAELAARACRLGLVQACRQAARLFRSGPGEIEVDERRADELMELGCPPGRDPCRP